MLEVVQHDIGLSQKDPFPVRVKVEPERFVFLYLAEGQEQDEANGKGSDPREAASSLHSLIPPSAARMLTGQSDRWLLRTYLIYDSFSNDNITAC
jgi:hypothetical protein